MACRNEERGLAAAEEIRSVATDKASIEVMVCDVSSLQSVADFVKAFKSKYDNLHALINNAGIMNTTHGGPTADGFELQFGTNHVGPYYLTELLLPMLKKSAPSRVVITSSNMSSNYPPMKSKKCQIWFDEDFLNPKTATKKYDGWVAYMQSKFANLLHMQELKSRMEKENSGVAVCCLHPGFAESKLLRHTFPVKLWPKFFFQILKVRDCMIGPVLGSQTSMFCAIDESINAESMKEGNCGFYSQAKSPRMAYRSDDRKELNAGGYPLARLPNPLADDAKYAERFKEEIDKKINGLGFEFTNEA